MPDKIKQPKTPKGDPNKQYDVTIAIIHDDRKGKSTPVQKPQRFSFATAEEATQFANQFSKESE